MNENPKIYCRYTELRPLTALVEHPQNPNTHPQSQLERLADVIRGNGWRQPITVSARSGYITKGHGRFQAAQLAGFREVPVEVQEYDNEAAEIADMLADNRIAELAEMDDAALLAALGGLQELDAAALALSGYTAEEFAELLAAQETMPEIDEALDEVVDDVPPFTQNGDVWELGDHRLVCGDSTLPSTVAALMQGELADLLLTDPPYNVDYEGGTKDKLTIQNDNMADGDFRHFLATAFLAADSCMKPGAAFYIWHADSEGFNFRAAVKDTEKWMLKQCLIWSKNTMVLGRQDYQWQHEPCLYGWKDGAAHYFTPSRTETTVLAHKKPARNAEHPTMKPVELFARLIHNSTRQGELVLDTFGGSGTTMIAAQELGRRARLCELDPHYCDVIANRFRKAYPEATVRVLRGGEEVPPPAITE